MKTGYLYLYLIVFATLPVIAQSDSTHIEHTQIIDTRPNEPIRFFSMRVPFRIAPISSKHEISVDYHIGNTWNPSGLLEYPDASEPYPKNPWEATYHPPYLEAPDRYQLYSADGVLRSAMISYIYKVSTHSEFYATVTANMYTGGGGFADIVVSDQAIELLHTHLVKQDDPFRRIPNGLDRAEMKFTDRQGRTLEIEQGKIHLSTIDIGYRHFVTLAKKDKILWTLSLTPQLGVPLNTARDHLSAGFISGTAFTAQIVKSYGITFALGYAAQHDKVLRINSEKHDLNYADVVTGYRVLIGQNFDFKKGRRFMIGVEIQGMTAPLNTRTRVTAPYINPEDVGIQTNYIPEYWTEENKINVTNQRRAARGLIRGSEYLALNFSYRFGKATHAPTIALYLQEDCTLVYDVEGDKKVPMFLQFNNAQDFGAGIKIIKPIRYR